MENNNTRPKFAEYIVLPNNVLQFNSPQAVATTSDARPEFKWSQNGTKLLIDIYANLKKKLGTMEIRSTKMLWEKISEEMQKLNINATSNNCLNRWRVLERNYKKYIDNQNKTGRGRLYFEHYDQMHEIFEGKKNIQPEILLASHTECDILIEEKNDQDVDDIENVTPKLTPRRSIIKRKMSTIEKIRLDRKDYYEKKLKLEQQKIDAIKERNALIAERNKIFRRRTVQSSFLNRP